MSILHDSLERHRRENLAKAGSAVPWTLTEPGPSPRVARGLFTRRTWLLLGGLVLFSIGVWGTVQLWPVSGGRETAVTPVSQEKSVGIRAPLVQQGEGARELASGQVESGPVSPGPVAEARSTDTPPHSLSTVSDHAPDRSGEPVRTHLAASQASSAPADSRPSAETPGTASPPALNQRTLEELNLRLSSLLAALPPSAAGHAGGPSGSFTERSLDGTDYATDDYLRHAPDHSAHGEPRSMASHAPDPEEVHSPPMVHVSVHQRTEPSHLAGIRPLEEELGRALRARDWAAFDLAYGRLAALQTADALAHWRAARAMAGGDYEEARQLLELLLRDNPFDLRTGLNLALVHEVQGEIEKARNIARALAGRHPLDSGLQAMLDRLENTRAK